MGDTSSVVQISAIFLLCLTAGFAALISLLRFWKFKSGLDAADGIRKTQERPVLRVGGIALFLTFLIGFFFINATSPGAAFDDLGWTFLSLGTLIFLLGFLDDLYGVSASVRLLIQVGVGIAAYLAEMRIENISNPFGTGMIELGGFSLIFTVFWFVALPNLINLVDGMDGLAGGIGLFLSLTLATIGYLTGNPPLLLMSLAMAGGLVAFLAFNLPPAKVYMGDGGAYLLGYFIAATSLITSNKGSIFGALLVVIIALGFPILDTFLAILRRGLSGLPLMHADARHLHHRLMTLGFSKRTVLMLLYGVFASLCLLGLSVFISAGYSFPIVGMIITVGVFFALRKLGLPHTFKEAKEHIRELIAIRKDVRYAYSIAQVLGHDLERVSNSADYWDEVVGGLRKFGINPAVTEEGEKMTCPQNRSLILFDLPGDRIWRLCCETPVGGKRSLERILRCFVQAMMDGYDRWGGYPAHLGVLTKQDSRQSTLQKKPTRAENEDDTIPLNASQACE